MGFLIRELWFDPINKWKKIFLCIYTRVWSKWNQTFNQKLLSVEESLRERGRGEVALVTVLPLLVSIAMHQQRQLQRHLLRDWGRLYKFLQTGFSHRAWLSRRTSPFPSKWVLTLKERLFGRPPSRTFESGTLPVWRSRRLPRGAAIPRTRRDAVTHLLCRQWGLPVLILRTAVLKQRRPQRRRL